MGRTLAHGRLSKEDPGEAFRQNGLINALGNKGIFGNHMDQLLFEAHGYEHILGSAVQVGSDFATMTWDQNDQRFEDKSGAAVPLSHYERIAVIGMDMLTDNIKLDNLTGLEIFHIGNTPGQTGDNPKFQLGNKGGGEPFKIKLGPNTKDCKLDLLTDKPFEELELSNLTQIQKQYIANQGRGNLIKVNGEELYNPSQAGQIVKFDTIPVNPYFLRMNGVDWPWSAHVNVNNRAWFRDLNVRLNGLRWNGSTFVETQSRFTSPVTIFAEPWLFEVRQANRFFTDLSDDDTRIHERADPIGIGIVIIGNFINTSNIVTFAGIGNIKNEMRISGASGRGIPDGSNGTTILRNVNTATGTAEMYDALTDAAVFAISGGPALVAIDNSGAVGGSHDDDYFQNITGEFFIRRAELDSGIITAPDGAITQTTNVGSSQQQLDRLATMTNADRINFDASNSEAEGGARTHDQTQPRSSGVYYYYKT